MNPEASSSTLDSLFGRTPSLIGTVHLPPLAASPGAPTRFSVENLLDGVKREARLFADHGFDGLMIENFGDAPFHKDEVEPHVVSLMAVAALEASRAASLPIGINVLRNDARAALAVALASGARFIRVNVHCGATLTDQGVIEGQAAETLRYRRELGADVAILADVDVKHGRALVPRPLSECVEECLGRGRADAIIVTGPSTGRRPDEDSLREALETAGSELVLVGSGVDADNVSALAPRVRGIIISSALRQNAKPGAPLDPERMSQFCKALGR